MDTILSMRISSPRLIFKLFMFFNALQSNVWAQDFWQIHYSGIATTGQYGNAMTLRNQSGVGVHLTAEKDRAWGITAGLHSTNIGLHPIVPVTSVHQNNWLLSGFARLPSEVLPGIWTLQLDAYQTSNDAADNGRSNSKALGPQLSWSSLERPLKIDFAYAGSKYQSMDRIYQKSASVAYGLNSSRDWIQIRGYSISHLMPALAMGKLEVNSVDVVLTHFLDKPSIWEPVMVSLGFQSGNKIYYIDIDSQVNYNLPLMNNGGTILAASWVIGSKTKLGLQWMNSKLFTNEIYLQHFYLNNFGMKITSSW
jgi:hypothetical protein